MLTKRMKAVAKLAALSMVVAGYAPYAHGTIISSGDLIRAESRAERVSKIELMLAREDVARELERFGVSQDLVASRIGNLTDAELLELEGTIGDQAAGGDAIGTIGVVFLVLLILELVGVIDIFKAI